MDMIWEPTDHADMRGTCKSNQMTTVSQDMAHKGELFLQSDTVQSH